MLNILYIFSAPFTIYIYLILANQNEPDNVSNTDIMNIKLYSLPICGWNLTHIFIFYILSSFIDVKIKNIKKVHLLVFTIGILWYLMEPVIYKHRAIHQKEIYDTSRVYKNVYIPRLDDIVFNTIGQMFYISTKYLFYNRRI